MAFDKMGFLKHIFSMKTLTTAQRAKVLSLLCEGMSLRATARVTDIAYNTVCKLLVDAGKALSDYQDTLYVNLPCKRVQVDEIWAFVGAKEKNATAEQKARGFGDIWTWTAICAETKLIPSWYVGERDAAAGHTFMRDLADRLANKVQLTSDGHAVYVDAVERAFGSEIDYAMLVKHYGESPEAQRRYSPAECIGATKRVVTGNPDKKHVSTSYAERSNLTLRMGCRRFTRLTNGFSKKVENHAHAVALHMAFYNLCRIHKSLRITPAMAAGVTDHVWSVEELVAIVEAALPKPGPRGPYPKRAQGL
jgi:IS1 family transposase